MDFAGPGVDARARAVGAVYTLECLIHPREKMLKQLQHQSSPAIVYQTRNPIEHALDPLHPATHLAVFDIIVGAGGFGDSLLELSKQRRIVRGGRDSR